MSRYLPRVTGVEWGMLLRAALLLIILIAVPAGAEDRIRVIDGDTFVLNGETIRLWGIGAPEIDQTCADGYQAGIQATAALGALMSGHGRLVCEPTNTDRYSRIVAVCRVGDLDLSAELVRAGMAVDWPRYSGAAYAVEEAESMAAGRGIWSHWCMEPWEWRRR